MENHHMQKKKIYLLLFYGGACIMTSFLHFHENGPINKDFSISTIEVQGVWGIPTCKKCSFYLNISKQRFLNFKQRFLNFKDS